jgi:YggT family protein
VLTGAIFIRVLLSWFPIDPRNPLVTILYDVTEPILEPLRRVIPRLGMIDLSPLVAILIIQVIGNIVASRLR